METPRTDKMLWRAAHDDDFERGIALCKELELENRDLRALLDKASQAISCFVDLRGMTATELKSAHNGICVFLNATKMLDEIKACAGNEEQGE
ncbi:hypothetical protein EOM81_08170 [bacterium]|nr:hypothetical protein [bacterium]